MMRNGTRDCASLQPSRRNRIQVAAPSAVVGEQFKQAAERLAATARSPLGFEPAFMALQEREAGPVVAVDGSSAVLADNGAVWVIAHRATAVRWPGPRPIEPAATVTAARPDDARDDVERSYRDAGLRAPSVRTAEQFADALRARREFECTLAAVAAARRGALILVDGALHGLPEPAQAMADRLRTAAEKAGVCLIGVAKRSVLGDAAPLVAALRREGPPGPWLVAVPDRSGVFVAKLHARAATAFRVDADRADDVGRLLPLGRDAVYVGYPYPLAVAHNAVALTAGHVAELKSRLMDEVRRQGGVGAAELLRDFHDVLDRNVPG